MSDGDCLFCKIVDRRIPGQIVFESPRIVAFKDIHPQAPVHLLLVPTEHIPGVHAVDPRNAALVGELVTAANRLAGEMGIADSGFRLVVNSRADGGQTVDHLHLHLLGGRRMAWPPG